MFTMLAVAGEMKTDNPFQEGEDRYFLSQGRNLNSARKNMYKFLCNEYELFTYEFDDTDITDYVRARFHDESEDGWKTQFPNIILPAENRAGIVEIPIEIYGTIIEDCICSKFTVKKEDDGLSRD